MIAQEELSKLDAEEKDTLILELLRRISELEKKLNKPKKSSNNSSTPSSKDFKKNKEGLKQSGPRKKSLGHKGSYRELHPHPDETLSFKLDNCPGCGCTYGEDSHLLYSEYDRIEIPEKF